MIENLVISQGGNNIYTFIGVLSYLNDRKLLNYIKNYYGVSAGAIVSTFLALKYDINEIKQTLIKVDQNKIFDNLDISNFFVNGGLVDTNNLCKVMKSIIFFKTKKINYSFLKLYNDYKVNLNIFATCIETKKILQFNHVNTPNIPIWKALVASCCVPLLFYPFEIKINKKKLHFIDGAMSNVYPINFIPIDQLNRTLGICYNTCYSCQFDNFLLQYLINIILLLINNEKTNYIIYKDLTIFVDIPSELDINVIDFINNEQKIKLFDHGILCAKTYYDNKKFKNKLTRSKSF